MIDDKIRKSWHPTKNEGIVIEDIKSIHSKQKVWWICKNGHEWESEFRTRIRQKTDCFFCNGFKSSNTNNLKITHPELCKEWHPTKNEGLLPEHFVKNSHKKVWWICEKGHEWQAVIYSRARNKYGCNKCIMKFKVSRLELRVFSELSLFFKVEKTKVLEKEIDVFLPDFKIGIEVDGSFWHKNKVKKDIEKNNFFQKNGILIIRLRDGLKAIGQYDICDLHKDEKKIMIELMRTLSQITKVKIQNYTPFVNDFKYQELCKEIKNVPLEKSLEYVCPEIAKEWHPTKNGLLQPIDISYGSKEKVWWICSKGHEWLVNVCSRTGKNKMSSCPYCTGQKVSRNKSFGFLYPEIAKKWHAKNNYSPFDVSPGSHKVVFWYCDICKKEWKRCVRDSLKYKSKCNC